MGDVGHRPSRRPSATVQDAGEALAKTRSRSHRSSSVRSGGVHVNVLEDLGRGEVVEDPFDERVNATSTGDDGSVSKASLASMARSRSLAPRGPDDASGSHDPSGNDGDGDGDGNGAFASPRAEPSSPSFQGRPGEIPNLTAELLFILVCSTGQLLFGVLTGNVAGLQLILIDMLGIQSSQIPWLLGSFLLANGLSVIVSGPLADLCRPKYLMCGAFAWQTVWNIIGVFSLTNKYLFFIVRGGQGLSVGVLVSASFSILGRVYQPGLRKTRVFSIMAAMAPFGYWLGNLQGGALSSHPRWIFATSSIISAFCCASGLYAIPNIKPALHGLGFRSFDYAGSALAVTGCALLVAGLTQGPSASWEPYTIVIAVLGVVALVAFFYVERKVQRPLLPPALWRIPGFTPLIISYL